MAIQSEQVLEENLLEQLQSLGYERIQIKDEQALIANLKKQLEKHNQIRLSDKEFKQVLNHLNKGSIFERAKILRDKMQLTKDDGTSIYLEFLNQEGWCKNEFQVTNQITISEGKYKNRYDVTILINGLPLVQIELKRRGLEIKEAFNQICRYKKHSFSASHGLFQYLQLFVVSNGINTKYFANKSTISTEEFKQTFFWADKENNKIKKLEDFTNVFLAPCHIAKMICKYIVLNTTNKILMVLRSYQYYASELILEKVKQNTGNGYIWHTTGSGKTLTSFKASQLLVDLPEVHKVVFVVDRKDLDYQTSKEFNSFSEGSVDSTDNTKKLASQLVDDTKLIVTTIQKLNTAISKQRYLKDHQALGQKRIVFIFDECHRSQFGDTHKRITEYFSNAQLFGFTGTPIFVDNAVKNQLGKRTTAELFGKQLHSYVITDAIKDQNVLKFAIEYVGRYQQKDSANEIDIEVEDIDTKELLEAPERLEKITDYIIANHGRKTQNKLFTGMFCVSSVDTLIKYYELFKSKDHNLKIATIFSYTANEEDRDTEAFYNYSEMSMAAEPMPTYGTAVPKHTREKLDEFIADYNQLFGTKFSTKDSQSFYNYYNDIAKRVREKKVDILLVVNMFLTGFDSPLLNTMYVDKNLKHHGLIQAFSRTNRIKGSKKSQGNIVCFRNLKNKTDDAISLFSNKDAKEVILMKPYEDYVKEFKEALAKLYEETPTVDSIEELLDEEQELEFVKSFRALIRVKNVLDSFADFDFEDLGMEDQTFEDYKSKYLELRDRTRQEKEKVSVLHEVDFEVELIHRDEVNVAYILRLLAELKEGTKEQQDKKRQEIINTLKGEVQLRSKQELIEKFIEENLPTIENADDIPEAFEDYWEDEKRKAFKALCLEQKLKQSKTQNIINDYLFTEQVPKSKEISEAFETKPKLLERKKIVPMITDKLMGFVETFINGI